MVMMLILLSFVILFPDAKGAESIQLKKLFPHTPRQKKKKKKHSSVSLVIHLNNFFPPLTRVMPIHYSHLSEN